MHLFSCNLSVELVKPINKELIRDCFQSRAQTAVHLVSSRQTGTATNILRALLAAAGKDIRIKADGVSIYRKCLSEIVSL